MAKVADIKCPHCGAKARAVLPPNGLIVLGPCPECQEFVALLSDIPFPIDKDIILYGSSEEKYEHIMSTITSFLEPRISALVEQMEEHPIEFPENIPDGGKRPKRDNFAPRARGKKRGPEDFPTSKISKEEIRRFVQEELPRLDDSEYFKTIFK